MLSPRAIAVQGLGFSVALVAMQGLLPYQQPGGGIDNSVGGSHRHHEQTALRKLLAQAREEDELLLAIMQTMIEEY